VSGRRPAPRGAARTGSREPVGFSPAAKQFRRWCSSLSASESRPAQVHRPPSRVARGSAARRPSTATRPIMEHRVRPSRLLSGSPASARGRLPPICAPCSSGELADHVRRQVRLGQTDRPSPPAGAVSSRGAERSPGDPTQSQPREVRSGLHPGRVPKLLGKQHGSPGALDLGDSSVVRRSAFPEEQSQRSRSRAVTTRSAVSGDGALHCPARY
jgi:hypothetical protein